MRFGICTHGQVTDLGVVKLNQEGGLDVNAAALEKVRSCGLPLVLRIARNLGLEAIDYLPTTASKDLDKILVHRLDQLSPWSRGTAHYGVLGAAPVEDGRMEVRLAIVPHQTVQSALSSLDALSLTVDTIDLEGSEWSAQPTYDLVPARHAPRLPWFVPSGAAALLLALVVVAGTAHQDLQEHRDIQADRRDRLALLEKRLDDLPSLRATFESLRHERQAILDVKNQRISSLIVIENLTRLLPDTTWLQELTIADSQLSMTGYSSNAAELPSLLESLPLFTSVTFTAPIERTFVHIGDAGYVEAERFALRMEMTADLQLAEAAIASEGGR